MDADPCTYTIRFGACGAEAKKWNALSFVLPCGYQSLTLLLITNQKTDILEAPAVCHMLRRLRRRSETMERIQWRCRAESATALLFNAARYSSTHWFLDLGVSLY